MEKVTLFQSLVRENKIKAAYLVARNEFYRKPAHSTYFEQYLEFCLNVGSNPVELETQEFFIKEAEKALGHYADHVGMNEKVLKELVRYRQLLVDARETLEKELQDERIEEQKKKSQENVELLKQLQEVKQQIETVENETKLEELLVTVRENDKKLRKEAFSERQQVQYELLSMSLPAIVAARKNAFTKKEKGLYNQRALTQIKAVFDEFRSKEESYYGSPDKLHSLVENSLFSYDISQFFYETKLYYNYVYAYIFDRLDDEGKFLWSQEAVKAEVK